MSDALTMRCERHPDVAAAASCLQCGRLLCLNCRLTDDDGLAICDTCLTGVLAPEPVVPETPDPVTIRHLEPVAWEQPGATRDLRAFVSTVRDGVFSPFTFMARVPYARGNLKTPLLFAVLCGTLGYLASLLQIGMGWVELPPLPPETAEALGGMSFATLGLIIAPIIPLMFALYIAAQAWVVHSMLRMTDMAQRPFEATFRVFCYAEVARVLLFLPGLGMHMQSFYSVFLLLSGMRAAHRTGFGGGLLALVPLLLMQVLFTGAFGG